MATVSSPEGPHAEKVADDAEEATAQARQRDQAGRQRDSAAGERDDRGARRDEAADARDRAARHRIESRHTTADSWAALVGVQQAADADRGHSHFDRVAAANDRADAAGDRHEALVDRMAAARDRRHASLDGLTDAYNRDAGLMELYRDLARASRSGQWPVVAFLDVDHLKVINDTQGHAAGDRALNAVAHALMAVLRPYDLVIRYGGDEFLCVVEGVDVEAAELRFKRIDALLAKAGYGVTVTVGLAQLRPGESTDSVIARADADLYRQREQRRSAIDDNMSP